MTTPNSSEQQDIDRLSLVVDGDYLYRAFKDVLGRSPTSRDRTDFEELKRYAASMRAGGYFVTARYFQRRQPSGPFYAALQRFGYELILTEFEEFESWRVVKRNILAELEALRKTDQDVLYVGGDSYAGEITVALLNLRLRPDGSRRKLHVVHFDRRSDFIGEELDTLDIVVDVEAVPPHVYRESDERSRYPEGYLASTQAAPPRPPQPLQTPQPAPALPPMPESPFGTQLREAFDARPELVVPPIEAAPPAALAPQPDAAPGAPRDILVLIDHENIDWALGNLIGPDQLNAETRPRWGELRRFTERRAAGGNAQFLSFLQHNDAITGFAVYLDGEEGFRPILLRSEPDDSGRRRPVVDEAIHQALGGLRERECDVLIVSNDGGYLPHMQELRAQGVYHRRFGVIGFVDEMSALYRNEDWIDTFDLERDVGAFSYQLPRRYMPIAVDDFDISAVLGDFGLPQAGAEAVEDAPAGFEVVLQEIGADTLAVIKAVQEHTPLGVLDAKRLVDGAPTAVRSGLSEQEAEVLSEALEAAGATVVLFEVE